MGAPPARCSSRSTSTTCSVVSARPDSTPAWRSRPVRLDGWPATPGWCPWFSTETRCPSTSVDPGDSTRAANDAHSPWCTTPVRCPAANGPSPGARSIITDSRGPPAVPRTSTTAFRCAATTIAEPTTPASTSEGGGTASTPSTDERDVGGVWHARRMPCDIGDARELVSQLDDATMVELAPLHQAGGRGPDLRLPVGADLHHRPASRRSPSRGLWSPSGPRSSRSSSPPTATAGWSSTSTGSSATSWPSSSSRPGGCRRPPGCSSPAASACRSRARAGPEHPRGEAGFGPAPSVEA